MDEILPPQPKLERLTTGFNWVEGPVWVSGSYLLFADIPTNSIHKVLANGETTMWMQPSGWLGPQPFGGHSPGSNGMTLDLHGRLVVAGNGARNIYRLETLDPKSKKTILADSYQGRKLNSPNDVIFRSNGDMYFTDPPFGLPTEKDTDPLKEQKVNGVYLVRHAEAQKAGAAPDPATIKLVAEGIANPNGIAFSPDEKFLYVNSTGPQKAWYRFRVSADGTLTDQTLLADGTADKRIGAPDGMKVDSDGNIYSAGPGGVWILAPDGKHIGTIELPERCGNVGWGGDGLRTLYITANASVYRIVLRKHGVPFKH